MGSPAFKSCIRPNQLWITFGTCHLAALLPRFCTSTEHNYLCHTDTVQRHKPVVSHIQSCCVLTISSIRASDPWSGARLRKWELTVCRISLKQHGPLEIELKSCVISSFQVDTKEMGKINFNDIFYVAQYVKTIIISKYNQYKLLF